jgi:hypothetical protein
MNPYFLVAGEVYKLTGRVRLAVLCFCCAAATGFAIFQVLPVLRLQRDDSYFIVVYLGFGWCSALISPSMAYLTATRNPGIVLPNMDQQVAGNTPSSKMFCKACRVMREPGNRSRIHHCRRCSHCVAGFDHHCGVVGVCIGRDNRIYFLALLCWGAIGYIALFTGTLKAIFLLPPDAPLILGLNFPLIILWCGSVFVSCFATFVSKNACTRLRCQQPTSSCT